MPEYEAKPPPRPKEKRRKRGDPHEGVEGPQRPYLHAILRGLVLPLLAVVVVIGGVAAIAGTPHIGWDYECRGRADPGGGCESYRYCEYYGVQGRRVVFPERGEHCGFIKMIRLDWGALWPAAEQDSGPVEIIEPEDMQPTPSLGLQD